MATVRVTVKDRVMVKGRIKVSTRNIGVNIGSDLYLRLGEKHKP